MQTCRFDQFSGEKLLWSPMRTQIVGNSGSTKRLRNTAWTRSRTFRGAIAVDYFQSEWQSQHFDDEAKADEFVAICKGLGCEVRKGGHDGHVDVRFRCSGKRSLVCVDDEEAHSLQTWLEKKGFQTEHAH